MPRQRFTQVGRSYRPTISITKQGIISINKGAYHRFDLGKYNYAVLFFDPEINEVGIMLLTEPTEEGVAKIRHRQSSSGADISAKGFLDYFGIEYDETTRYKPDIDEENGNPMIVFRVEAPSASPEVIPGSNL